MLSVPLDLARHGRRCPQRPDPRAAPVRRRGDRLPADDRRAPGRDRREGPADGRGRGAAGRADRARRRAGRAAERRDPRAADAAVDRARLRRPAGRGGRRPRRPDPAAAEWRDAASDQLGRLDRLVDSILASVRGEGLTGLSRAPFDAVEAVDETVETLRLLLRPRPDPLGAPARADDRDRRRDALPPGPRAAPRERIEVRADRRGREHRCLAGRRRDPGLRHRRRPGRPASRTGRASSSRSSGSRAAAGVAVRGSGCSPRVG